MPGYTNLNLDISLKAEWKVIGKTYFLDNNIYHLGKVIKLNFNQNNIKSDMIPGNSKWKDILGYNTLYTGC